MKWRTSRHSSYILGSVGFSIQVFADWWDAYSHLLFGKADPWWNPAHLTLYFGIGLVILAVWRGLRTIQGRPVFATPVRFANTTGLKTAGLGAIIQIIAGVWNEIVHHVFLNEPKIAPAHALLIFGMLIVGFGMILGLSIENEMIRHDILIVSKLKRWLTLVCMILTFASIWLAAAGSLIYVARIFRRFLGLACCSAAYSHCDIGTGACETDLTRLRFSDFDRRGIQLRSVRFSRGICRRACVRSMGPYSACIV